MYRNKAGRLFAVDHVNVLSDPRLTCIRVILMTTTCDKYVSCLLHNIWSYPTHHAQQGMKKTLPSSQGLVMQLHPMQD